VSKPRVEFNRVNPELVEVRLDGQEIGYLEREQETRDVGTRTASHRVSRTTWGWQCALGFDGLADTPDLGPLRTAQRKVREMLTAGQKSNPKERRETMPKYTYSDTPKCELVEIDFRSYRYRDHVIAKRLHGGGWECDALDIHKPDRWSVARGIDFVLGDPEPAPEPEIKLAEGDRVEGGEPGTEDYDAGRVVEVDSTLHSFAGFLLLAAATAGGATEEIMLDAYQLRITLDFYEECEAADATEEPEPTVAWDSCVRTTQRAEAIRPEREPQVMSTWDVIRKTSNGSSARLWSGSSEVEAHEQFERWKRNPPAGTAFVELLHLAGGKCTPIDWARVPERFPRESKCLTCGQPVGPERVWFGARGPYCNVACRDQELHGTEC
jgi:hypothetical protein